MKKKILSLLLAMILLLSATAVPVSAVSIVVCNHDEVSTSGKCQNEACGAQALARFVCGETEEYLFTSNNLGWKTISMNNNDAEDVYSITVLEDIPSVSLTILADHVTLDLNGFSLGYTRGDFGNIVYLDETGDLTIMDSSAAQTGSMTNPTGPVVDFSRSMVESNAVLTIKGGTLSGNGMTVWLGGGTLYVEGGTIVGQYQAADGAITGGRFSLDPSGSLTEEYEARFDGTYYIVEKKKALTVPVRNGEEGSGMDLSAELSDRRVTVSEVDMEELRSVIGSAESEGNVVFDFSALDADFVGVDIPSDVIECIADASAERTLTVVLKDGQSMALDAEALSGVSELTDGEYVSLSIGKAEDQSVSQAQKEAIGDGIAYDVTLKSGEAVLSDIGGRITLSVPYALAEGETAERIAVYYVDENGRRELCETSYDAHKEMIRWETDHLSVYMIAQEYDFNSDRAVDVEDALLLIQRIVEEKTVEEVSLFDANRDGSVDVVDVIALIRFISENA